MGLGVRGRVDDGWRVVVSRLLPRDYGNIGLLAHLVHHLAARGRHATRFVGYDCQMLSPSVTQPNSFGWVGLS